MRVIATINMGLDARLSVRTLFDAPSVQSLSRQLGTHASVVEEVVHDVGPGATGPSFASVHGRDSTELHADDLTLDKFIDATTLTTAPTLPGPSTEVRTVLLTGATGFLGRYLALEWLERMDLVDGTLICLVRAESDEDARRRLDKTFDSGDPKLLRHFQELAADHLEVIAGDKCEVNLGLDQQTWQQLADTVDLIVDPAALVNHVLPYSQLFGPNVVGTAELIRIALTTKIKPYSYVSTGGVGEQIEPSAFTEDADIRVISPARTIDNGYVNSKWAGEVLLREANDLCALPVAVFRCDMILADTSYAGQLNVPDNFTRLILSLMATGIAPGSFYQLDADANRQSAHFDGLPVEFVAEAIGTLGARLVGGFETYHVMNPHDDGIGFDEYVDWLIEAGYPIQRIADFGEWAHRFETALSALPDRQRLHSLLWQLPLHSFNVAQFQSLTARSSRPRIACAHRSVPCCGARGQNRPRQGQSGYPPCLAADHHQIRHRLETARTALARGKFVEPPGFPYMVDLDRTLEASALVVNIRAHHWWGRIHWVRARTPPRQSRLRRRCDGRPAPAGARWTSSARPAAVGAGVYRRCHPCA